MPRKGSIFLSTCPVMSILRNIRKKADQSLSRKLFLDYSSRRVREKP
jgi:hypothetical protein